MGVTRGQIARGLDSWGMVRAAMGARSLWSPWITVLTFHRALVPEPGYRFDDEVIDTTPADLDLQLAFLRKHCSLLTVSDLLRLRAGGKLPANPVLLTFDDGYLDNHQVVLPLLQRHGAVATFFVSTSYVQDRRLFWWDKVNYLVKGSERAELRMSYPTHASIPLDANPAQRRQAIRQLLRTIKSWRGLDLARFMQELGEACGVFLTAQEERRLADGMLMRWEHVRALRDAGMDVQSHGRTHRVLQTLPERELRDELAGSRSELEAVLGEPVRAISYPVGRTLDEGTQALVAACGYELGFSNAGGVNPRRGLRPFDVRRMSMDGTMPPEWFRAVMAFPALAW
jgi:peptidoglycan/xylan/chitin deacetylase (PgdA/CDA1 family)